MAVKFYKPSIEELTPLKTEATLGGQVSESAWLKKLSDSIAKILRHDPRNYRAYGPYWWVLKRILIDHGHTDFGETIDLEWYEHVDYGDPVWNMLAAWLYGDTAMNIGLIYSNTHRVSFNSDEEGVEPLESEYTLVDDEVETLAIR